MTVVARRFTIRWRPWAGSEPGKYSVSIPNYDGGEVVVAEDYDALAARLRGAVEALRELHDEADYQLREGMPTPERLAQAVERAAEVLDQLGER